MAKRANAGELRTKIQVFDAPEGGEALNENGYPTAEKVNVFGVGGFQYCKWVNAHGSEILEARQAGVMELATLTLRYTPKITTTCDVYRGGDTRPYEVISINDVEDRHIWLEVKVQREAPAK